MNKLADKPFGNIDQPDVLDKFGNVESGGIGNLLNLFFNILIVTAGVYALINIIFAGYGFINAGNDPKKIQAASSKIMMSVLGLVIVAGAFLIAAIIGIIFFDGPSAILSPVIEGPPA